MFKYYIIAATIVIIDQITKFLTVQNIPLGDSMEIIPGIFSLTYIQNTGAAWSILEGQMWFFYIITLIVVVMLIYFLHKEAKDEPLFALAISFILGGALGNFVDRLHLQYVIDMFQLDFISFPIFNIADSALTVGVIIMLLYVLKDEFFNKNKEEEENND